MHARGDRGEHRDRGCHRAGEGLGKKEKWREHLKVHRRGGQPCPRCGSEIKAQVRSGSETNYCVVCQPLFGEQRGEGERA
ncbi:MAG: hypothetical protein DWG80_06830 [Chloroflexi bacterium]|nr:hypothetical protein [Chloroflexota bacterium]